MTDKLISRYILGLICLTLGFYVVDNYVIEINDHTYPADFYGTRSEIRAFKELEK